MKTNKSNLEKITKDGFSYTKRWYFDQKLEVYERPKQIIVYNPETDELVLRPSEYEAKK